MMKIITFSWKIKFFCFCLKWSLCRWGNFFLSQLDLLHLRLSNKIYWLLKKNEYFATHFCYYSNFVCWFFAQKIEIFSLKSPRSIAITSSLFSILKLKVFKSFFMAVFLLFWYFRSNPESHIAEVNPKGPFGSPFSVYLLNQSKFEWKIPIKLVPFVTQQ